MIWIGNDDVLYEDVRSLLHELASKTSIERVALPSIKRWGRARLRRKIVLLDAVGKDDFALAALAQLRGAANVNPIIVILDSSQRELGPRLLEFGADDFLIRDRLDADTLGRSLRYIGNRLDDADSVKRSEGRLRAFMDNTPALVFIKDEAGHYVYLNRAIEQFVETTSPDLLGKTCFDRLPEDVAAQLRANDLAVLHGGRAQQFQEIVPTPDGSFHQETVVKFPIEDIDGRKLLAGIAIDITDRKRAEDERDRFFSLSLDMLCVISADGYFRRLNSAWERILGYSQIELTSLPITEWVHPEDLNETLVELEKLRHGLLIVNFENRYRCRDGSYRWLRWNAVPDTDSGLVFGVATDISERKQAEAELRQSQELLAGVVNSALDAIITIDHRGDVVLFNPAAERMFGYSRDTIVGQPLVRLLPERLRDIYRARFNGLSTERLTNGEMGSILGLRANNEEFPIEASISHVKIDGNKLSTVIMRDITERKRSEEELRRSRADLQRAHDDLEQRVQERTARLEQMNKVLQAEISERQMVAGTLRGVVMQLERAKEDAEFARLTAERAREEAERANAAKSDFLSRMSHELRTPMNSILGFAQIMEMNATDEKQAGRIEHILKAGQHLLALINEVLDVARVESGRLSLSPEPVALRNTVQMAVDLVRPLCAQRHLQLLIEWNGCESMFVQADQQRLSQVLINLLSNATKYNREGGTVRVSCYPRAQGWVRVCVSDTGLGIAPELLPQLFQPFERLTAEGSSVEGTGLGLALSKRLVEAMQGRMGVESKVNEGSMFWLELPEAGDLLQVETEIPLQTQQLSGNKLHTILHIEDNPANLSVLEQVLEGQSNIVLLSAMQGHVGLDLARQYRPSLIFLDLHLPDVSGEEVLLRLQDSAVTGHIPVVIVSADATFQQISRMKSAGATEFLTKPLDVHRVLQVVHTLLESQGEDYAEEL